VKYPEECPVFEYGEDIVELRPACFEDGETRGFLAFQNGSWIHPCNEVVPLTRAARELLAWSRQ
jgi:hypothetical protein